MMQLGFTGTSKGITDRQHRLLAKEIAKCDVFHHGDCIGADAQAHDIARAYGAYIILHPPDNGRARAFCIPDEERAPLPYLDRNQAIVDECDYLVACPKLMHEEQRSGTWATVRRARKAGKKVVVLWPRASR